MARLDPDRQLRRALERVGARLEWDARPQGVGRAETEDALISSIHHPAWRRVASAALAASRPPAPPPPVPTEPSVPGAPGLAAVRRQERT